MSRHCRRLFTLFVFAATLPVVNMFVSLRGEETLKIKQGKILESGSDGETCWLHARAGVSPDGFGVLTAQKFLISGSDIYYDIYSAFSTDHGRTWSELVIQDGFARIPYKPGTDQAMEAICEGGMPKYHAPSGKFLMTGHLTYYRNNVVTADRFPILLDLPDGWAETYTWYTVFDIQTKTWSPPKFLSVPADSKALLGHAGCTERVDLADGTILLPVYAPVSDHPCIYRSVVLRCSFDGEELRYIEEGDPLLIEEPRGFFEPSLIAFEGKYYLTLRNDKMGYVAVSDDGLHFDTPIPWRWQKGEDGAEPGDLIGSYNTPQHWLAVGGRLYLVYTRRGANNDHVIRNRAPLFIAEFDPETMTLRRQTERIAVPEHAASLGNFGTTAVSADEGWVVVSEDMQSKAGLGRVGFDDCV
ncbi:MAG: exo-alpha-sialidase, partial [Thermoguttaceae bacterium]|nr:exo-alpha-sialidase [Thermoguttaceae bacterium]